jgi:CelD/BcsL family acetyltransferase involved in cellulose biosynthesis
MTRAARAAGSARTVRFDMLSGDLLAAWHDLRDGNPALDSPYFHPGFAAAVHAEAAEVRVVVDQAQDGAVRCLLPVQQDGAVLRPAGWPAADFQGPIAAATTDVDPLRLLGATDAKVLAFDHLRPGVPGFDSWTRGRQPSPHLDVIGGLPDYLARASRTGRDNMAQARRHGRRAERDHGPLRFVAASGDHDLLDRVIELKRGQYAATGARDYFAGPGRRRLLHRLLDEQDAAFGGLLSAVHAGPHLLAAHFGLRSREVLHWWFPVYDPQFSRLAPGWLLLRMLVDASPALGVHRIDLGRGEDEYKRRAMTGQVVVGEGFVASGLTRQLRSARRSIEDWTRSSSLGPPIVAAVRRGRRSLSR